MNNVLVNVLTKYTRVVVNPHHLAFPLLYLKKGAKEVG